MLGVHFNQKMKLSWLKCTADFNYLTETTEKKDRRGRIRRSWMGWHVSGAEQEYSLGGDEDISLPWGANQRRGDQFRRT